MLGNDISFAAFKIVEVMSSAKLSHKRVDMVVGQMLLLFRLLTHTQPSSYTPKTSHTCLSIHSSTHTVHTRTRTHTQLQMLGYDISFAAFKIVEVMSSAKFSHKRVGYMAAALSFNDDTDILMLTTNMLKKVC